MHECPIRPKELSRDADRLVVMQDLRLACCLSCAVPFVGWLSGCLGVWCMPVYVRWTLDRSAGKITKDVMPLHKCGWQTAGEWPLSHYSKAVVVQEAFQIGGGPHDGGATGGGHMHSGGEAQIAYHIVLEAAVDGVKALPLEPGSLCWAPENINWTKSKLWRTPADQHVMADMVNTFLLRADGQSSVGVAIVPDTISRT